MNDLLNLSVEEVRSNELPEGDHVVTIKRMVPCVDTQKDYNSPNKEPKDGWVDETPQLAVVFVSKDGIFTHRYNGCGYKRFSELTKAEQKLCTPEGEEGYAVIIKTRRRVEDKERTKSAREFLHKLGSSAGLAIGEKIGNALGKEVVITIKKNKKQNSRVTSTKPVSAVVAVGDEEATDLDD